VTAPTTKPSGTLALEYLHGRLGGGASYAAQDAYHDIRALIAERDELIAALRACMRQLEPLVAGLGAPGPLPYEPLSAARAAIAMAEGGKP
jgi:hypothetical protein